MARMAATARATAKRDACTRRAVSVWNTHAEVRRHAEPIYGKMLQIRRRSHLYISSRACEHASLSGGINPWGLTRAPVEEVSREVRCSGLLRRPVVVLAVRVRSSGRARRVSD